MRPRIMPVVVLALVAVALLGGAAYGDTATDNAQCLTCHGASGGATTVDFGVGPVDKATACNKCHWITNHPIHYRTAVCQECHGGWSWSARTDMYVSQTETPSGYFTSATSVNASPAELHRIHSGRSWPAEITDFAPSCASCHAAASCDACHSSSAPHGEHGVNGDPAIGTPTTGPQTNVTQGAPTGFSSLTNLTIDQPTACAASACHAGIAESQFVDAVSPAVTLSGVWTTAASTAYTGGSLSTATEPGAYAEVTFSGTGITWIGSRNELGGIVEVSLDGVRYGEVNLAIGKWGINKNLLVINNLEPGTHTLRITNTGTTTSVRAWTTLNGFRVYGLKPAFEAVPSCSGCHFTFEEHYDATAHSSYAVSCSGTGCHATPDLMTVHNERNDAFSCASCHSSIRVAVQDAITAGDTSCGACHGAISGLGGHRDAHAAVPSLASTSGTPNYSYYTGSAGTAPTRDCVGCHTSNLVDEHMGLYYGGWVVAARLDNTGAAFSCGTCHDKPEGSAVQSAITAGQSACESCHPVHGPINALHASTFVDDSEVPCADCHNANLAVEHNGKYTSSAGLTGCDVCHDLYEGLTSGAVTGADTMAAIDTANDTRCSACHTAYHTDSAAHEASGAESLACGSCHAKGQTVIDVAASALHPTCATCHKSTRLGEISGHTAECGSCHATEGTDYHSAMTAGHTYTAMDESCASCHANTLPEVHTEFLSRYPAYDSTCDLCHKNADPSRIDWATASADCSSCHEIHGDIAVVHTATSSQACVDCHESADVRTLHAATPDASCDVCHNAPAGRIDWATATVECTSCHGMLAPVDPKHYPAQAHSATTETGCTLCHSVDVKTEHFKSTVAVSCVACHELKVDTFTAPWDKTCTACHPTKHANQAIAHKSTNTACTGTGCHVVTDVSVLHGTNCAACHAVGVTASTNCTLCHSGSNPHHVTITLMATTDSGWKTMCGSCHGRTHSMSGCSRCHSVSKLHSESRHVDRNSQCAGCHKIAAADASDDCLRCHASLSSGSGGGSWGGGSWGGGSWGGGSWGGGSWGGR